MKKKPGSRTSDPEPAQWVLLFDDEFKAWEWAAMDTEQRKATAAAAAALAQAGPGAGRPLVGTLKNRLHPNMKELRYDAHGGTQVWRAVFAFDPQRNAIVLVAGDKQGKEEARFYVDLLARANRRYAKHLKQLAQAGTAKAPRQ